MTNEVPKSGWFKTIITGNSAIKIGTIIDLKYWIFILLSDKYLARAITKKILASSLGWKLKGKPMLSHLYVPAWVVPKKGSITKIEPILYITYAYLWIIYIGVKKEGPFKKEEYRY